MDEPSRGEVGAEIEDSKGGHDASIESPLRVTRSLMGVDAVDGTIGATAVSYMTGEGATDVPCIAQLPLSCLSEDSAEEAAHSSALSLPKSMTDEVVSVNVVSCEMNRDGPGGSPSLPFTSKPPEECVLSNITQLLHKTIMLSAITRHTTVCVQIFELSLLFE